MDSIGTLFTKPKLILIAGPSGAGKTTFTEILARRLNGIPLHLDDLFFGHNKQNFDNPIMIAKAAGIIARKVSQYQFVIADFLFYKEDLRRAFGFDIAIYLKRGETNGFEEAGFDFVFDVPLCDDFKKALEEKAEYLTGLMLHKSTGSS